MNRTGNCRTWWIAAAALFMLSATSVFAQTSAGSITGTVKDSSAAAVPGASVVAANPTSGVKQTVTTNRDGEFVFPQLPPGTYTVTVELDGFKRVEKSNVILSSSAKVNAGSFVLEVGTQSELITVEADAGQMQIQTESAERSELVTNRQLRDIALNGRNAFDFMKLVPGAITTNERTQSTVQNITDGVSFNGTRGIQHEYTVDGVTNLNLGNNSGGLVSINPDALEEIKVLTSNYQAEYGRAGGGYVAMTTRGGTNEYHGGLRYFRRHESMNANLPFNNMKCSATDPTKCGSDAGLPRQLYRYNDYGWDFGGPVPGIGSKGDPKLFFFLAQEYYDQLVPAGNPTNIRVPTAAERIGDFSQSVDGTGKPIVVKDPLTGQQFPGNIIPTSRIYGPGQAALNVMPLPNAPQGGNNYNYSSQVSSALPRREDIARVDWQIASSTRLSARYVHNYDNQDYPYGTSLASFNFPLTNVSRKNGPGDTYSFTLTHNFSPTLVNELTYGAGRGAVSIAPVDDKATRTVTGIKTPLLYPQVNADWGDYIPGMTFGTVASASANGNTAGMTGPFEQHFTINTFTDSLTKVAGNHTFKAGLYYQRASNASNSQTLVASSINFSNDGTNPLNTGYAYSNALLGVYDSYSQANAKPGGSYFYYDLSGYIQDTWKIHPRLTLDLGIRLSHFEPMYNDRNDNGTFFNPDLYDPAKAVRLYRPVCVTYPCSGTNVRAQDPKNSSVTPTLDNTLSTFYVGKIVPNSGDLTNGMGKVSDGYPRGGIDSPAILYMPRLGFSWDMTGDHKMVLRGGFGISYDRYESDITGVSAVSPPNVLVPTLTNGYLQDIQPGGSGVLGPLAPNTTDRNAKWPMVYSYSAGIQRDLWKGIVIDVAYVGSQSRNNVRRYNLNAPALGAAFKAANQDPTKFSAGGGIPAVEPNLPSIYSTAGVNFSGANALATDFLRPYQGYGDIRSSAFDGSTTYNSLQAQLKRHFGKSLSFGVSYLLSKAVTTVSTSGIFTSNIDPDKYDRGLANWNRTHYLTLNYVWNLPKVNSNGFVRAIVNNWTFSGFSWYMTGNPAELGVTISGQDAALRLLGTPSGGNLSGNSIHYYVTGNAQGAANEINPSAYRVPGVMDIGPYNRYELTNPGFVSHDMTLAKNIPFGGKGRRYLQLRLEAFNVFNSTQWAGVNRATNITNGAGKTGADGTAGSALFGDFTGLKVTNNTRPAGSTSVLGTYFGEYNTARNPRVIQVAAKLYF